MSSFLEKKYLMAISHRFEDFVQKLPNLYNCRCTFCGDSKSNKRKKRGYFYYRDHHWWYHCHNCGKTCGIKGLLKQLDYGLYEEYQLELFQEKREDNIDPIKETKYAVQSNNDEFTRALKKLPKISQLPVGHHAREYLNKRKIPSEQHSILRWCPAFMSWTNELIPHKFDERHLKHNQGRIVFPFFSEQNEFFAYAGRAPDDNSSPRYILIVLDHSVPLLYGVNTIDRKKKVYVCEGQIDSLFVKNSIALNGGNLAPLTNIAGLDMVIIFDNEPRKPETRSKIEHAIDLGYQVCIWPNWITEKDINSMILAGSVSVTSLNNVIDKNTFQGLGAKMHLAHWGKA